MKLGWGRFALYSGLVLLVGGFLYGLVEAVITNNTGFETKTLWDWMELLIVPSVLAGGAFFLNRSERNTEREIAMDRQQEAALQSYFDRMSELLLKEKLRTTRKSEVRDVARTRTLSIMRVLDTKRINLIIQFLSEAKLITDAKSIFNNAKMNWMNLPNIRFADAYMVEASLADSNLELVSMEGVNLGGAHLEGANLQYADLEGANLKDASLFGANLEGANLEGANLEGANLLFVNLRGAYLHGANLKSASLMDAKLEGSSLKGANLMDAYLYSAILEDADLENTNLENVNLENANLMNAKNIIEKQLASVKSLNGAIMPDGTRHG